MIAPLFDPDIRVTIDRPTPSELFKAIQRENVRTAYMAVQCGIGLRYVKLDMGSLCTMLGECSDVSLEWQCEILRPAEIVYILPS